MYRLLFVAIATCLLASCSGNKAKEETPETEGLKTAGDEITFTAAQYKNAGIQTGQLGKQTISSILKLNGSIDVPPQNIVSISVPLGGYLKSTKLLPGMHIRKGEVLGVVEDQQYIQLQQDFLTARAQIIYDEAEYNRQKELNESKAASDKVFQAARANFQKQVVLINSLKQKLRLTGINPDHVSPGNISRSINIYSPIDGFVSAVNVNIGKYVTPSEVMFELVNPADIHLALTVFEKDISKMFIGQKVLASTNTNPEKKYPCTVILISKKISDDRATEVHCHFESYDKTLIPGTYMNGEVEVSGHNATAISDEAIVRFENRQYVFIAKDSSRFSMEEIVTGNSENGFTEIIGADKWAGKTFVIKGAYNLLMAMKNVSDE
jgi:membrane fusion protein, heavy metal efflux system